METLLALPLPLLLLLLLLPGSPPPAAARPDIGELPEEEGPDCDIFLKGLEPCPGCDNADAIMEPTIVRMSKHEMALGGTLDIRMVISEEDGWRAELFLYKQDGDNAQSRVLVAKIPIDNMCEVMEGEDYQRMLNHTEGDPAHRCPLKPGKYKVNKFPVNFEGLKGKLQEGTWIAVLHEYTNAGQISCYEIEMLVKYKIE